MNRTIPLTILNRIPRKWLSSTRDQIDQAMSMDTLIQIVIQIKKDLGVDYYSLGTYFEHLDRNKDIVFITSDTPEAWQKKYKKEKLILQDTRIIKARQTSIPFMWKDIENESYEKPFLQQSGQHQLNHGITFPVHGPGGYFGFLFFIYKTKPNKMHSRFEHITPYMQIISMQLIEALRRVIRFESIFSTYNGAVDIRLSKRQRECLVWAAEGKTSEEIAIILNLSSSMVNRHLESASRMLHSDNRVQCIAKAVDQKLIVLEHKKKQDIFYLKKAG